MNKFYQAQLNMLQEEVKDEFSEQVPISLLHQVAVKYKTTNYDQLGDIFYSAQERGADLVNGNVSSLQKGILEIGIESVINGEIYIGQDTADAKIDAMNKENVR